MEKKKNNNKKKETFAVAFCVVSLVVGAAACLQWFAGPPDIRLLAFPANLFICIAMAGAAGLSAIFHRSAFFKVLAGGQLSAALILGFALTGIVMGLLPQSSHVDIERSLLPGGFHAITGSWPFVLLYASVLFVLMCVIIRRAICFRWRDYGFYLNHIGLLLLMLAAGPGGADKDEFRMIAYRNVEQDAAYHYSSDHPVQLPFAVVLNNFEKEIYPAWIAVVDLTRDENDDDRYIMADCGVTGATAANEDMEITVLEYLHNAIEGRDGDFHAVKMEGGYPAALVRLRDMRSGETLEGWVGLGNYVQYAVVFSFGNYMAYMLEPEAKRYASDITLDDGRGDILNAVIEVNKPLRYGHWTIYQYGYDTEAGKLSQYSVLQIVYDRWLGVAYAGIIMLAAGSLTMLWSGRTKRKRGERL